MNKEEYDKLIDITLKLRIAESMSAELAFLLRKANEVLRELLLKKGEK